MPVATPIAATGPRVDVSCASARVRVSMASATVNPEARIAGPVARHGALHRLVLVLDLVELLAVARDQEQAVVGCDPEHQNDQDRRAVRGDRRPGVGVEVDESGCDRVREEDDDERGKRDEDRAIDQAEQDQDQQRRRDQELQVEIAEDLLGVRREAEIS